MSSKLLLRARDINKTYTGTKHPFATLRHALFGAAGDAGDEYPVLHGIDFEVSAGETVGIMGQNGAGKTTLLGILGKVIQPTSGSVERYGRIATLLGLTAGFNNNFTGRENAYLFCSIQGLTRQQIGERISSIEVFASIGRYFDLPMRTYSSGMQSRLAFACAIHVDAEMIIIDETLAVGDANFRMKCYDRMRAMQDQGQTFLVVHHSQNVIANFCTRVLLLESGKKVYDGPVFEGLELYKRLRKEQLDQEAMVLPNQVGAGEDFDNDASILLADFMLKHKTHEGKSGCEISATLTAAKDIGQVGVNFGIRNQQGIVVAAYDAMQADALFHDIRAGSPRKIALQFENRLLPGKYFISMSGYEVVGDVKKSHVMYQSVLSFEVIKQTPLSGIVDLDMRLSEV